MGGSWVGVLPAAAGGSLRAQEGCDGAGKARGEGCGSWSWEWRAPAFGAGACAEWGRERGGWADPPQGPETRKQTQGPTQTLRKGWSRPRAGRPSSHPPERKAPAATLALPLGCQIPRSCAMLLRRWVAATKESPTPRSSRPTLCSRWSLAATEAAERLEFGWRYSDGP